jgi:hypothetical protein
MQKKKNNHLFSLIIWTMKKVNRYPALLDEINNKHDFYSKTKKAKSTIINLIYMF